MFELIDYSLVFVYVVVFIMSNKISLNIFRK